MRNTETQESIIVVVATVIAVQLLRLAVSAEVGVAVSAEVGVLLGESAGESAASAEDGVLLSSLPLLLIAASQHSVMVQGSELH